MAKTAINTLKNWFKTGLKPSQEQFWNWLDSYWHKDEKIPISAVDELGNVLDGKAQTTDLENLVKKDASNIDNASREALRARLGVGDIPDNVALVDVGEAQEVYNKMQIDNLCMLVADFVMGGKIRADKIEALGLTEIHEVNETSLTAFTANSANYEYEKNDIIAISNGSGNFSLYIYKGGVKTVTANYLPTGLTNITIAMVEGLQSVLDGKLDKPSGTGNYFARANGGVTSWIPISPSSYYLTLWNGSDFTASVLYQNSNKLGIGTTTPSEMLHLEGGRIRTKAVVFDINTERLPNQITFDGTNFFGTSSTGVKRDFMYKDFADFRDLWLGLNDDEKNEIKTIANGGWTTNTMSIGEISPKFIDQSINANTWILIRGANLNVPPTSFSLKILDSNNNEVVTVPNSQIQLFSNGLDLSFYYNFNSLPVGIYKIKLWNGVAQYISPYTLSVTNNLQTINTNLLTWDLKKEADFTLLGSGSAISFSDNRSVLTSSTLPVASAKSSKICDANENVYVEFDISYSITGDNKPNRNKLPVSLSLISDLIANQLQYLNLTESLQIKYEPDNVPRMFFLNSDTWFNPNNRDTASAKVILVRENNMLSIFLTTSIVTPNKSYSKSINIAPNQPLSILAQFPADSYRGYSNISILRGYKF